MFIALARRHAIKATMTCVCTLSFPAAALLGAAEPVELPFAVCVCCAAVELCVVVLELLDAFACLAAGEPPPQPAISNAAAATAATGWIPL
jgi:hypothetical protein